ncbi:MAG: threonine/serine exporter family protein [Rikenellaceae bacterium]
MTLFEQLLADAIFSAVAATGFAVISNPPKKAVVISAMLSAIGHSFRYYLLHAQHLDIGTSTFFAAFIIGMLSLLFGKIIRCPSEVFTFPSLLPMIPGMYAYNMFLSLAKFMRSDSTLHIQLIEDIFKNGLTAIFVMLALVVGVSLPILLFHKQSYMMSRNRRG